MSNTGPSPAVVLLIRGRDDWRCARCAGWGPLSTQHRVARGMGGTRTAWVNAPGNLLTVCGDGTRLCHGWIEAHPRRAQLHGWAASRARLDTVAEVPVWTWRGWVLLDHAGDLTLLADHPGVPGCSCGCRPMPEPDPDLWARALT